MSEATDQAKDLAELMRALLASQAALESAEKAAKEYGQALADGKQKVDAAAAAEVEAARIIAQANAAKAEARFRAEADGSAAAKREADAATQAARAIEAAEKKKQDAYAETVAKSDSIKAAAVGALGGEETVEKYNKFRESMKLAGDESLSLGQRAVAMGASVRFAAGTVGALANVVVAISQDFDKAAAATFQYDQRVNALRGTLNDMRAATAGTLDTQVAFSLELAVADRGIRANAQQMATLARATREYARVRQVSQQEASQVVTSALDGDAQAAARLGVRLEGASTSAQRHAAVLAQLAEAQRHSSVATADAAEQARVREQAEERASNKVKEFGNRILEAITPVGLYRDTVRMVSQVDGALDSLNATTRAATQQTDDHTRAVSRVIAEQQRRKTLEEQIAQDQRRARAIEQGAASEELSRLGRTTIVIGEVVSAERQYISALAEARSLSQRAGETDTQFAERRLQTTTNLINALKRKNAEDTRQDGLRNAEAQIGLAARQARQLGLHVDARIRSVSPAQRLVQLQRELAEFAAREGESLEQTLSRRQQLMQEANASAEQAQQEAREARERARERRQLLVDGFADHRRLSAVERERGETQVEYLRRRVALQRELGSAISREVDLNETLDALAGRAAARTEKEWQLLELQRERNEMVSDADVRRRAALAEQQRDQQQRFSEQQQAIKDANDLAIQLRSAYGMAEDASRTATQRMVEGAKSATDGLGELGKGAIEAVIAASQEGKDAGAAIAAYVDQWATQKAIQWGMQSAESFAGAGLAYFLRPDAVPGLLAAGATYAGLALTAGGVAAAIPNAPAASSGSAGGSGGGLGLAASSRAEAAGAAVAPNIVFNINGVMANEQTQEVLARGIRDAADRGLLNLGAR